MHAIVTLHDQIQPGELTKRREANGGGAGIQVDQHDGQTATGAVRRPAAHRED